MLKRGGQPDLTEEAIVAEDRRQVLTKQLQGDEPVVLEVPCEIHCCHTAMTKLLLNPIAVLEELSETSWRCGYVAPRRRMLEFEGSDRIAPAS
jgi:hypothetical protein